MQGLESQVDTFSNQIKSNNVRSEWCQNGIVTNSDVKYVCDDHELVRGIEENTHMIAIG